MASLTAGRAVFVIVKRDRRNGTIRRVKVQTFDTLEHAQAELARKQAGRKHPRN